MALGKSLSDTKVLAIQVFWVQMRGMSVGVGGVGWGGDGGGGVGGYTYVWFHVTHGSTAK